MTIAKRNIVLTFCMFLCFLWTAFILHQELLWNVNPFFSNASVRSPDNVTASYDDYDDVEQQQERFSTTTHQSSSRTTNKQIIAKKQSSTTRPHHHPHHEGKFIMYEFIRGNYDAYNYTFDPIKVRCRKDTSRTPLPIPSEVDVTDFRARIKTNLNILFIGDSVGTQFAQSFQDAAGAKRAQVIRYAWGPHKLSHIARVEGGGKVAGLRVTGFFLEQRMNDVRRVAPFPGGGWWEHDVREMKRLVHHWRKITSLNDLMNLQQQEEEQDEQLNHQQGEDDYYKYTETDSRSDKNLNAKEEDEYQQESSSLSNSTSTTCPCCKQDEKKFDVVVHQFPAAWIYESSFKKLLHESMTEQAINKSITDTIKFFCPKTIIVQTVPIMNNVFSALEYVETNRNIFNVVHKFRETNHQVTILVMDLAALSTSFVLQNALSIGALSSLTQSDEQLITAATKDTTGVPFQNHTNMTNFQKSLSHYTAHVEETSTYALVQRTSNKKNKITSSQQYHRKDENEGSFSSVARDINDDQQQRQQVVPLQQVLKVLLQQRLRKKRKKQYWRTIISHGCGHFVTPNTTVTCPVQNQFSVDGQHWCMDVIGSRIDGVLACLLQCSLKSRSLNDPTYDDLSVLSQEKTNTTISTGNSTEDLFSDLENCERKCNSIFMNLSPISFENGMFT